MIKKHKLYENQVLYFVSGTASMRTTTTTRSESTVALSGELPDAVDGSFSSSTTISCCVWNTAQPWATTSGGTCEVSRFNQILYIQCFGSGSTSRGIDPDPESSLDPDLYIMQKYKTSFLIRILLFSSLTFKMPAKN